MSASDLLRLHALVFLLPRPPFLRTPATQTKQRITFHTSLSILSSEVLKIRNPFSILLVARELCNYIFCLLRIVCSFIMKNEEKTGDLLDRAVDG